MSFLDEDTGGTERGSRKEEPVCPTMSFKVRPHSPRITRMSSYKTGFSPDRTTSSFQGGPPHQGSPPRTPRRLSFSGMF
ncbi:hypothetical protein FQA47_019833, partial [Oryzias melastigma]